MAQMLTESVVLSVFGGLVGTILGGAIALVIARLTRCRPRSNGGRSGSASESPPLWDSSSGCIRPPEQRGLDPIVALGRE